MLRLLFVTVTMTLFGLGGGYFLWGSRVARLTEALSGLTLELDTMREKLLHASGPAAGESAAAAEQLRVINESLAAIRVDLSENKALLEKSAPAATGDAAAAGTADAEATAALRRDLDACEADKKDLQMRLDAAAPRAAAPGYPAAPAVPAAADGVPRVAVPAYPADAPRAASPAYVPEPPRPRAAAPQGVADPRDPRF